MTSTMRFDKWENTVGQPYGTILQVVSSETTTMLSGTLGSSANPTSTDGTLFHSFTFTPKFANSKLLIQSSNVYMGETSNIGDEFYLAAYYDTTRVALSAGGNSANSFSGSLNIGIHSLNHVFNSWGTSTKTISIRVGSASNSGGSMYVNQNVSYNMFNSAARIVSFTVMEIAQ